MRVSQTTRELLFDELASSRHSYHGALSEEAFLSRLVDLSSLPTTDGRPSQYPTMREDLRMHRVNFPGDWPDDWVWNDERLGLKTTAPDDFLLTFLSQMVHPLVRRDPNDVADLLSAFNKHLHHDGLEIVSVGVEDGRSVYGAREIAGGRPLLHRVRSLAEEGVQIRHQLDRAHQAEAQSDPALAIGTAKELVETICKTVLRELNVAFGSDDELPKLAKLALGSVDLVPSGWADDAGTRDSVKLIVSNLGSVVQRLGSLRNSAGSGHGREANEQDLLPMHAHLAINAATTVVAFLVEAAKRTRARKQDEERRRELLVEERRILEAQRNLARATLEQTGGSGDELRRLDARLEELSVQLAEL